MSRNLVDEEMSILLLQRAADLGILAQESGGEVQQIAVVERVQTVVARSRPYRERVCSSVTDSRYTYWRHRAKYGATVLVTNSS